jgi:hypothetical protein
LGALGIAVGRDFVDHPFSGISNDGFHDASNFHHIEFQAGHLIRTVFITFSGLYHL